MFVSKGCAADSVLNFHLTIIGMLHIFLCWLLEYTIMHSYECASGSLQFRYHLHPIDGIWRVFFFVPII